MKVFSLAALAVMLTVAGCAPSLVLEPANFAWPLESVLQVNDEGKIQEDRYTFSVNVSELFLLERGATEGIGSETIRIIRSSAGNYFFTAEGFQHVYIFTVENGAMKLLNQVLVSNSGIVSPAFNQRQTHIELLNGDEKIKLTTNGIGG